MFNKQTVKDVKVRGQNVLVRTDYNVPLKDGEITDDLRIRASLPTLELLRKKGARRIIVMSHLGRPKGEKVPELSMAPMAKRLQELMPDAKVSFVADVSGPDVEEALEKLPNGGILVLENLRFYPGEEKNSTECAREIAESTHADIFVQDGFAVIHRAHASTAAITGEMMSIAGLLLEKEVSALSGLAENPKHPFVVIIGGAKVEDKQPLIKRFLPIADKIIVGGKIAADGYKADSDKIYVVEDFIEDPELGRPDAGPVSRQKILDLLKDAKTVLWNGTLGVTEDPRFAESSERVADFLGSHPEITSVICGGDTTGFVENYQKSHPNLQFALISTGGGASLELLSGLPLPGLEGLDEK